MRETLLFILALFFAVATTSCGRARPVNQTNHEGSVFVFVRIPEPLMPLDRASKYEDPLNATLKTANLGEVTGGGSQLAAPAADGKRGIEWVGIDIELADVERGIPFLKAELARLGAPATTVLEFNRSGARVEEHIR